MAKKSKVEKFYICEDCGTLTTVSRRLEECSNGGMGMCNCRFMDYEWDDKWQDLEPWFPREFREWTEISERWYDKLGAEKNNVLRVRMFEKIPMNKRMMK